LHPLIEVEEVRDMMLIYPADLLPRHRHLLQQDYLWLGKKHWLIDNTGLLKGTQLSLQQML
jgi:hypothetical protein